MDYHFHYTKLQIPIREGAFMNHNFICTRTTNFPFKKEVALYNILHDVYDGIY